MKFDSKVPFAGVLTPEFRGTEQGAFCAVAGRAKKHQTARTKPAERLRSDRCPILDFTLEGKLWSSGILERLSNLPGLRKNIISVLIKYSKRPKISYYYKY